MRVSVRPPFNYNGLDVRGSARQPREKELGPP